MQDQESLARSGIVSIIGRPNSGKSTLLNFFTGEKVSIVTDKPQTTRNVVRGIVSKPEGQIVFLDTPGIHRPIHKLNERMMKYVRDSMAGVDLVMLIVDSSQPFGRGDEFTVDLVKQVPSPRFLLLNKIDRVDKSSLLPIMDRYSRLAQFAEIFPISALTGENIDTVERHIFKYLPEGPPLYPVDQISDQHERRIAAEIIREKLILATSDELPYSTAVIIEHFEESDRLYRLNASIFVERESQKRIVIGKGGNVLKQIGTAARLELESFFDCKVFLELHVTVKEHWRDDADALHKLGIDL